MREFELYGTVAATISVCDSINYITEPEDLLQVFKLVNNYLAPRGVFIFDSHPRYYKKEVVGDATIAEDRDNISFIWDNYYDEEENLNELALSLFIKDDTCKEDSNIYRKHQEFHLQKGYTLEEILNILAASGLELVAAYDAFTRNPATEECERIYIIAREKGKSKNSV